MFHGHMVYLVMPVLPLPVLMVGPLLTLLSVWSQQQVTSLRDGPGETHSVLLQSPQTQGVKKWPDSCACFLDMPGPLQRVNHLLDSQSGQISAWFSWYMLLFM